MKNGGITLMLKFQQANSKKNFSSGIDYIGRKQAQDENYKSKETNLDEIEFAQFMGYMGRNTTNKKSKKKWGNEVGKLTLFNKNSDLLSNEEQVKYREDFNKAQEKGSNLFKSIFSFRSEFLEEYGLLKDGILNENKLKEYTRASMGELLKKENIENASWIASIHKDTNHFHIHIGAIDPNPVWEIGKGRCKQLKNGEIVQRGYIKKSSKEAMKSKFANKILNESTINIEISNIMRNNLQIGMKNLKLREKNEFKKDFTELIKELPDDKRLWKYGMNKIEPIRTQIDALTDKVIQKYFKDDIDELYILLENRDNKYLEIYGERKNNILNNMYSENTLKDMYRSLGNVVLSEAKGINEIYSDIGDSILNEISVYKENKVLQNTKNTPLKERMGNNFISINTALYKIKNITRKNIDNLKNQAIYEKNIMERE